MARGRKAQAAQPQTQQSSESQSMAINHPVIIPSRLETQEQELHQGNVRVQHSDAKIGEKALDDAVIQVVDRPVNDEKMAMLKFFDDDLIVRIATTADKNAEQVFEINVNGRLTFFRRGEDVNVKRFIVDHMLRMKQTVYHQKEMVNDRGEKSIANIPTTSLKYDLSIKHDPHPRGREWMQAVMSES